MQRIVYPGCGEKNLAPEKIVQLDTWLTPATVADYDESDFPSDEREDLTTLVKQFRSIAAQAPSGFRPVAEPLRDKAVKLLCAIYDLVESKIAKRADSSAN